MSEIIYRKINENELNTEIFSKFNRYQQVNKCWRKRNFTQTEMQSASVCVRR